MIKFFRRIRQHLLTENKFSKYILYAIGEIVLVVIGILIALQINNWNEGRKDQAEAIKILKKLQSEFEINKTELDASRHFHEQQYMATVRIEELFNPNHNIPTDTITNLLKQAFIDWKFEPRHSITTSAMASGKIALINNDSLIDNLNTWIFAINKYHELYAGLKKDKDKFWVDVQEKYPMRNFDWAASASNFKGDPEGLFSSLKNENLITLIKTQQKFIMVWCDYLQEDHDDILRFIRSELSKNEP